MIIQSPSLRQGCEDEETIDKISASLLLIARPAVEN
jgi:hypothetical protein